jgi:signal transduction histidine kinase
VFAIAELSSLSSAVRRVLALVDARLRNRDPEERVTERTSELQLALEALEPDKVLELHLRVPLRATGDAERFRMAVEHFLRDADAFSPTRSRIRVGVYGADDRVHVVVSDEGSEGIGELPEAFDLRGVA